MDRDQYPPIGGFGNQTYSSLGFPTSKPLNFSDPFKLTPDLTPSLTPSLLPSYSPLGSIETKIPAKPYVPSPFSFSPYSLPDMGKGWSEFKMPCQGWDGDYADEKFFKKDYIVVEKNQFGNTVRKECTDIISYRNGSISEPTTKVNKSEIV